MTTRKKNHTGSIDRGDRQKSSSINHRKRGKNDQNARRDNLEAQLIEALKSPALNGGFDTMMAKVEKIEETQDALVLKVNDIHEAIYHPDEGLFARINSTKVQREKDVIEFQAWRNGVDKDLLTDAEVDKELKNKVENHENTLVELKRSRDRVSAVFKWLIVALGGGGISLLFQWLSTFIGG